MKRKILIGLVLIVLVFIIVNVHRYFFEFDNGTVKNMLRQESQRFGNNAESVYKILNEMTHSILASASQTRAVRMYAKNTNLPKERVLVDKAVTLAQSHKYIK